ncbi:PadR family transcriptional regulator [Leuconostocaceae bacterium ESL0723]|nr:PadR family transcriptional regulator [Lactobacillaceae bacterium L1_55_11]WEV53886.1 PadR family transcriptional regulator [Leuconostocaceae bacterium ESL0723]
MQQHISSQMLKGILQGIMLIILSKKPDYGYGISKQLNQYGLENIPKGTIYPLLTAMEKRQYVEGRMQPSEAGPDRKYYYVTEAGEAAKEDFIQEWDRLAGTVTKLIEGEKE